MRCSSWWGWEGDIILACTHTCIESAVSVCVLLRPVHRLVVLVVDVADRAWRKFTQLREREMERAHSLHSILVTLVISRGCIRIHVDWL